MGLSHWLSGESPHNENQSDETTIQTQLSHWLTETKWTKTNSQIAWGFPHATPTKTKTEVAWVSHMLHQQQSNQNKTTWRHDARWMTDECKMDVKPRWWTDGMNVKWHGVTWTWNGYGTNWWQWNMTTINIQIQTNSTNSQLVQEIRSVPSTNNCNNFYFLLK